MYAISQNPRYANVIAGMQHTQGFFVFMHKMIRSCISRYLSGEIVFDGLRKLTNRIDHLIRAMFFQLARLGITPAASQAIQTARFGSVSIGPTVTDHERLIASGSNPMWSNAH